MSKAKILSLLSQRGSKKLADQTKKVFFCSCKQTNDQPLCDGSHNI